MNCLRNIKVLWDYRRSSFIGNGGRLNSRFNFVAEPWRKNLDFHLWGKVKNGIIPGLKKKKSLNWEVSERSVHLWFKHELFVGKSWIFKHFADAEESILCMVGSEELLKASNCWVFLWFEDIVYVWQQCVRYIVGVRDKGKTIVIVHGRQGCGDRWQFGKRHEWRDHLSRLPGIWIYHGEEGRVGYILNACLLNG